MRILTGGLGLGVAVFGIVSALFPEWFARLFGFAASDDPTVATAIRSVGVRDLVIGLGLFQAAREANLPAMRRWLIARAACDAGDTLSVGLAVAAGARNTRFVGLGALAASAAVVGIGLARGVPRG